MIYVPEYMMIKIDEHNEHIFRICGTPVCLYKWANYDLLQGKTNQLINKFVFLNYLNENSFIDI